MRIRVLPRAEIVKLVPTEPFIWISITDPGKQHEPRPDSFARYCRGRLCLNFWDSEDVSRTPGGFWTAENPPPALPLRDLDLFQPWQAERIVLFLLDHQTEQPEVDLLVINCEGGQSRSPQVAEAIRHLGRPRPEGRIARLIAEAAILPPKGER